MTKPGAVTAVRAVGLVVQDLAAATRFFTDVWGLAEEGRDRQAAYFRGSSGSRWILSLRAGERTSVDAVMLDVASLADLKQLRERVAGSPGTRPGEIAGLSSPGGGSGFSFRDPEGRTFVAVADVEDRLKSDGPADMPTRISHVNLNTADFPASSAFMVDVLGFRPADQTRKMQFLACNRDHHSVVLAFAEQPTLNHVAFEMTDLDAVMRGVGRLRDHGHPVEWGPGRHGPGHNAFAYFVGPENLPLEYTAEMQQCDESHVPRPVESWTWPAGRLDHWGLTPGPSDRFKATQAAIPFAPRPRP